MTGHLKKLEMLLSRKLIEIKQKLTEGVICLDDILLHVEPLLMQSVIGAEDEARVTIIINGIERAIYTQIEPEQSKIIHAYLDEGILFLTIKESK